MSVRSFLALGAVALLVQATAADAEPVQCQRPLVPDASTARAIFAAVEPHIARPRRGYRVEVVDQGATWAVFRTPPAGPRNTRQFGGGGLELEIDKCNAAVKSVRFAR